MFKFLPKVIPALIFWGIFVYVVLQVPYPTSLTQASLFQLIIFFIPLFLALTFTLNLFLNSFFLSASVSLGIIFLLFLKALDTLNFVSGGLVIISVLLLVSYFKKRPHNLTSTKSVPKLNPLQRRKR